MADSEKTISVSGENTQSCTLTHSYLGGRGGGGGGGGDINTSGFSEETFLHLFIVMPRVFSVHWLNWDFYDVHVLSFER